MLDQRELASRIQSIRKAKDSNEPASVVIAALEALRKEGNPTEEMIRNTKAGMFIGKLRTDSNKDIARAAAEVVQAWKKAVEAEKKAKGGSQMAKLQGSASPASIKSGSPAPKPTTASKNSYTGDIEKRHYKTDKIDINRTGSTTRDNIVGLLYNGLAYRSREAEDNVLQRAIEVENAAYKHFKGETKDYKEKMRSLFQNLKVKANEKLRLNVMTGTISAERFVTMSSKELQSEEQRKADAVLEKENMRTAQAGMPEKSISDSLECGSCKQKKVAYTQAQTRSADEPMTTFCECMNCGKRWKFS
ncbi:transcription factor S-II, central domain-containing protein [Microdochium trichocladiopsis]|uniref:Transcription elongation factor n=1 Tax=Microdochium trichocladiopsis TaxID=1682393 RepID=A0A9P8Y566_9PEZI|nr:transcription factor S-II, central domain-containing protein [Microdochium trichocladiopsis]KAH7027830.1 transcription factor S-II, central domain-containing protein [Microdochium trichocladiopsis]